MPSRTLAAAGVIATCHGIGAIGPLASRGPMPSRTVADEADDYRRRDDFHPGALAVERRLDDECVPYYVDRTDPVAYDGYCDCPTTDCCTTVYDECGADQCYRVCFDGELDPSPQPVPSPTAGMPTAYPTPGSFTAERHSAAEGDSPFQPFGNMDRYALAVAASALALYLVYCLAPATCACGRRAAPKAAKEVARMKGDAVEEAEDGVFVNANPMHREVEVEMPAVTNSGKHTPDDAELEFTRHHGESVAIKGSPWTEYQDDDGYAYYHNFVTGETTYERPEVLNRM